MKVTGVVAVDGFFVIPRGKTIGLVGESVVEKLLFEMYIKAIDLQKVNTPKQW